LPLDRRVTIGPAKLLLCHARASQRSCELVRAYPLARGCLRTTAFTSRMRRPRSDRINISGSIYGITEFCTGRLNSLQPFFHFATPSLRRSAKYRTSAPAACDVCACCRRCRTFSAA
jgi:hypothetical protein